VRKAQGHASEPSTGIMDSQSVVSAPQKGDRLTIHQFCLTKGAGAAGR
jgi:hypothetical protein